MGVVLRVLVFISWKASLEQPLSILLLLIAVVLAFLRFNLCFPHIPYRVFMGDAGSMFLGFMVAWFLISLSQSEQRVMTPVTALWILAVPLFDTGRLTIHRLIKGQSPFAADREHFHHLLLDAGLTKNQTLLIMLSFATGFAVIGILGLYLDISEALMFWGFIGLFVLLFFGIIFWQSQKSNADS